MLEFSNNADVELITKKMLKFKDIVSVKELRVGKIKSNERNKIQNFSHCLILTFENEKELLKYIEDPYHVKFLENHLKDIVNIYTADFNSISIIE